MYQSALYILSLLSQYGYAALFVVVFIEGPIASIVGGMLAATGVIGIIPVFFIINAANMLGDIVCYVFGRYGGRAFFERFERLARYAGITEEGIDSLEQHAHDHGGKTILMAKLQVMGPLPTGVVLLTALGIGKMPFLSYLWYNILGTAAQAILLEGIGYLAGDWLVKITTRQLDWFFALLSLILLAGGWWLWRRKNIRSKK